MAEGLGESTTRNLWELLTAKLLADEVKNRMVKEVGRVGWGIAHVGWIDHDLDNLCVYNL